jgi:hypothetical protein
MRVALAQLVMSAVLMLVFAVSVLGALAMAGYGLRVLVGRWDRPVQPPLRAQQPPPQRPLQAVPIWVPPAGSVPAPMVAPPGLATPLPLMVPAGGIPLAQLAFMPPLPGGAPVRPAPPAAAPPLKFMPPQPGVIATAAATAAAPAASAVPPPPPPAPAAQRMPRLPMTFRPLQPDTLATGTPPPPPPAEPAPMVFMPPQPAATATRPPLPVARPPRTAISAVPPPPRQPRAPSPGHARLARGSIPPDYVATDIAAAAAELEAELDEDPDTDPSVPLQALASADAVVQRGARFSVVRSRRR